MEATNIHGVQNLLDIINIKKKDIKWIQLGSAGIYKKNYYTKKDYEYVTEDSEIHTNNYYERPSGDNILLNASRNKSLRVYISGPQ